MDILSEEIKNLVNNFNGNVSLYAQDEYGSNIKINENDVVESASTIKTFILIEYYKQILEGKKSRDDIIIYDKSKDYVENGSGIVQYLESPVTMTSKNAAILMIILSDNIMTGKMIEYLGIDNINNTIRLLGFKSSKLLAEKLDFSIYKSVGKTTAYEYAMLYKMLLNNEILTPTLCEEIIDILSHQQKSEMLTSGINPKYLEERGKEGSVINYIASKSGGLGDEGEEGIVNCRNDGGIICTKYGSYVISIFINNFKDHYFYQNNPATLLGIKISKMIFEQFEINKGKFNI